jgi:hypothetical protein
MKKILFLMLLCYSVTLYSTPKTIYERGPIKQVYGADTFDVYFSGDSTILVNNHKVFSIHGKLQVSGGIIGGGSATVDTLTKIGTLHNEAVLRASIATHGGLSAAQVRAIVKWADSSNVYQGDHAAHSLTTGTANIIQGPYAGYYVTSGGDNVIQGESAGMGLSTGDNNLFQGYYAGSSTTDKSRNIYIGSYAGKNLDLPNRFIINSISRVNIYGDTVYSIIYGVQSPDPTKQRLYLNATVYGGSFFNGGNFATPDSALATYNVVAKYVNALDTKYINIKPAIANQLNDTTVKWTFIKLLNQ